MRADVLTPSPHSAPLAARQATRCLQCERALHPTETRYVISDRTWCARCASPYSRGPVRQVLADGAAVLGAFVAAFAVMVLLSQTLLHRLSLTAGGFVFTAVLFAWYGRRKVDVDVVRPTPGGRRAGVALAAARGVAR